MHFFFFDKTLTACHTLFSEHTGTSVIAVPSSIALFCTNIFQASFAGYCLLDWSDIGQFSVAFIFAGAFLEAVLNENYKIKVSRSPSNISKFPNLA